MRKVFLGSDHAGFKAKEFLKRNLDVDFVDLTPEFVDGDDYPLVAEKLGRLVVKSRGLGVLICGSGLGMMIAANKVRGVRAAFAFDVYSARKAREDNNANVLTLRGRRFPRELLPSLVSAFLSAKFSRASRHCRRVRLIKRLEDEFCV